MMKMGEYTKARMYYSEAIANMKFIIHGDDVDIEQPNSQQQSF